MTNQLQDTTEQDDNRRSDSAIDLENYLPALLTFLAVKFSSGAAATYRRRFGIGITDWRIMLLLAIEPWMVAGRISELFAFDKAAVSRSINFMQSKGLVETRFRDNNQRRQHIALTPAGLRMHDEIVQIAMAREQQLVAGLSEEERKTVVRLLTRMLTELPKLSGDGGFPDDDGVSGANDP